MARITPSSPGGGGGSPASGASQFTVPTTLTGWDVADATGTWVDNGDGTISQTDIAAISDNSIYTSAGFVSLGLDITTRIRIDAVTTDGAVAEIGFFADYPNFPGSANAGSGLYASLSGDPLSGSIGPVAFGVGSSPAPQATITHPLGEWHTYRFVLMGGRGVLLQDDVVIQSWLSITANSVPSGPGDGRVAMYASGGVTFDLNATVVKYTPLPS